MGVFRNFPYSNFHEMNMDEIIKIVKNMLEEWAQYHAEWDAWMNEINDDWSNYQEVMNEAWENMQNFINNYFDNLDVQNEINNKITSMVDSGEFATIVEPFIPPRVTEWLTAHITQPVGVVIDTSLTVAGACADAKATGDAIKGVKSDLNDAVIAFSPVAYESKEITSNNNYIQTSEILTDSFVVSGEIKALSGSITHALAVFAQGGKNLLPYISDLNVTALGLTVVAIGNGGYRIFGTSTGTGNVYLNREGAFPAIPLAPNMYYCANNSNTADGISVTLWSGTDGNQSLSLANADAKSILNLTGGFATFGSAIDGIQIYCSRANTEFDVTIYPVVTFDYNHHEYDSPAKITNLNTDIINNSTVNINGFPLLSKQPCLIYTRTDATNYALSVIAPESTIKKTIDDMSEMLEVKNEATAYQIIENHFIQRNGDTSPFTSDWVCTDYLDVTGIVGDKLTISCSIDGYASLAFYDEDRTLVSYISGDNASDYGITPGYDIQQFTIDKPSGVYYTRLSGRKPAYTTPSQLFVFGRGYGNLGGRVTALEKKVNAIGGSLASKKVLIIGDSISSDAYGNYKKWVTDLIDEGILTNSLVTNSSQHATGYLATYNSENNTFMDRLSAIADKSTYDLLVIYGGTNDYIQNIPMGTESGDASTEFASAVKALFEYAIQNFTQARICIISPTRTYATWTNSQGLYETDYFSKIREIAKEYCYPVLNLTEDSGFCPYIQTFRNMWTLLPSGYDTHDGVHPTEEYEKKYLAPMIRTFLESLI